MTQPEETNKEPKRYSTFFVVGSSLLLAVVVSVIVFLWSFGGITIPFLNNNSKKSLNQLYEEGLPREGLKKLNKLTPKEKNSAENLLWQGKLAFLATWKQYNDSAWDGYAENADDWFHSDVLDGGIQALNKCLKSPDTRDEAHLYLGLIYFEKGKYDKAESYFRTLLKESPKDSLGILNLSVLHSRRANYFEAVQLLEKGLEYHPQNGNFLKNLFWLHHFHLKESEKAINYGNRFLLSMKSGDPDKTKVIREIRDIISRFPEYDSDTLVIHENEPPVFKPRKSAERMRLRNRNRLKGK